MMSVCRGELVLVVAESCGGRVIAARQAGACSRAGVANDARHAIAANQRGFPSVNPALRKSRENTFFQCALRTGSPRLYVTSPLTSFTGTAIKISTFCTLLLLYFMETLLSRTCIRR